MPVVTVSPQSQTPLRGCDRSTVWVPRTPRPRTAALRSACCTFITWSLLPTSRFFASVASTRGGSRSSRCDDSTYRLVRRTRVFSAKSIIIVVGSLLRSSMAHAAPDSARLLVVSPYRHKQPSGTAERAHCSSGGVVALAMNASRRSQTSVDARSTLARTSTRLASDVARASCQTACCNSLPRPTLAIKCLVQRRCTPSGKRAANDLASPLSPSEISTAPASTR